VATQRRHPRRLQARRAAAGHQHLPRLGRRLQAPLVLVAGERVDGAVQAPVHEDLRHAGVAVDAGAHVFGAALGELAGQLRVGEELAAHRHEVGPPLPQQRLGSLRLDSTHRDHRDSDGPLDASREVHEALLPVHQGGVGEGHPGGRVGVGAHVHRVGARLLSELRGPGGVLQGDAALDPKLPGVDPRPHREIGAGPLLGGTDRVAEQAGAVLQRTTPLVVAEVRGRREERGQDVAVARVKLDAVEASPPRPLGGRGEVVHQLLQVLAARHAELRPRPGQVRHELLHLLGGEVAEQVVGPLAGGKRGPQQRTPFHDVAHRHLARVLELDRDAGTVGVGPPRQLREPGKEGVVGDRHLVRVAGALRPGDGPDPDDQQAHPAPGALLVVALDALAHVAVGLGQVRAHRRHQDPVAQLEGADPAGREEVGGGVHPGRLCLSQRAARKRTRRGTR
jgi:hypothetical protein